jgi:hypothetical protein
MPNRGMYSDFLRKTTEEWLIPKKDKYE